MFHVSYWNDFLVSNNKDTSDKLPGRDKCENTDQQHIFDDIQRKPRRTGSQISPAPMVPKNSTRTIPNRFLINWRRNLKVFENISFSCRAEAH